MEINKSKGLPHQCLIITLVAALRNTNFNYNSLSLFFTFYIYHYVYQIYPHYASPAHASISLVARNESGTIVGVLFGLTDFAYWLYVTDLGVDRAYTGQGVGRQLMKTAHEIAGGEKNIAVYLIANENAIGFYEKLGMKKSTDVMQYNKIEWTDFVVE